MADQLVLSQELPTELIKLIVSSRVNENIDQSVINFNFFHSVFDLFSFCRLGSSSVRHLTYPGHTPVTTVSWSPSGQLLVSGSPADSNLMVGALENYQEDDKMYKKKKLPPV